MKLNIKGFTLVELIAVIAILALIVVLATPPIIERLKKVQEQVDEASLNLITAAVDLYLDEHADTYPNYNGSTYCLTLEELVKDGKLKPPIINLITQKEIALDTIVEVDIFNQNKNVSINNECIETIVIADTSGASAPELTTGMIPVKWDNTNWIKADINNEAGANQWYDYNAQEWANAVTVTNTNRDTYLNAAPGAVISMSDINTMWVWIPRYKYAIPTGTGERSINIVFESETTTKSNGNAIDTNYRTHPAFTFGTTEVNGIWVGKFETTGTIDSVTILPNTTSIRSQTVKAMYDASRAMQNNATYGFSTDGNIHMAKNSEWGAVAYLSHSKYGINNEIYKNNSSGYFTGRSGGNVGGSQVKVGTNEYRDTGFYTYDGKCATTTTLSPGIASECTVIDNNLNDKTLAYKASTTGNIYGVYDMSGGSWEYVMGMYRPTDATSVSDSSGFGATTTNGTLPTSEYWERYTTTSVSTACSSGICYGSALSETSGWHNDDTLFVNVSSPWSRRGGDYVGTTVVGIFYFDYGTGASNSHHSFRVVQLKP